MGSPGERDPAECQPASGLHKVCITLCSLYMERVLIYLRPHRLCWTFALGIARLSPRPTSLFFVVALRMGGILLFPYLWSPVFRTSLVFSLHLVSSRHLPSALLRPHTTGGSVDRTIYNSRITVNAIAGPLPVQRVEVGWI